MRSLLFFGFGLILTFVAQPARAQYQHQLLRRLAVFPVADTQVANGEEAWWQAREILTKDQRFLVASRRFMINRGVFQPRDSLKPADAIILGKILDAQALVTLYVVERRLYLNVYDGENGYLLWQGEIEFHPALPINEQIIKASQKLMSDFILALPYQASQMLDPIREKAVFDEGGEKRAWVSIGNTSRVEVGDPVQWIEISGDPSKIILKDGLQTQVVAEGQVVEVKSDRLLVRVQRVRRLDDLKENSLVRLPKEVSLLRDLYRHDKTSNLASEYLMSEMRPTEDLERRHSTTTTSLAFISTIATMILLAF